MAKTYGNVSNIVIPIGKFNYIWSKEIDDFFSNMENEDFYDIICNQSFLEDYYENEYGKGKKGSWFYNDYDTGMSDKYEAVDIIIDVLKDEGEYEDIEDEYERQEELEFLAYQQMTWVPEIDIDEFFDQKVSGSEDELYSYIKDNYVKNKYFKDLMDSITYRTNEVMLDCKEYYNINEDWAVKFLEPAI